MTDGVDRRDFLRNTLVAGGAAAAAAASVTAYAQTQQPGRVPGTTNHYHVPATDKTVHWGYFSKLLKPVVEVASGRREQRAEAAQEARRGPALVREHDAHRVIREGGGAGVLRVRPARFLRPQRFHHPCPPTQRIVLIACCAWVRQQRPSEQTSRTRSIVSANESSENRTSSGLG